MGLTQVSTDGVKNDAITKTKIPANQIEASELADNAVDTNAIANGAVTSGKIASGTITNANLNTYAGIVGSKLADSSVGSAKIADQAVTLDKLPHGTSSNNGKFLRANNGADPSFEDVPAGGISDVVADTSPQLGGNLDANSKAILLGDSTGTIDSITEDVNRLCVGAGRDFQIVHNGNDTYLNQVGTGSVYLRSIALNEDIIVQAGAGGDVKLRVNAGENALIAETNAGVTLYYNNISKLEVIDSGINVNGGIRVGGNNSANELDDYEEGSFTTDFANGANYAIQTSTARGQYVKIGQMVYVRGYIRITSVTNGQSWAADVSGLPFTSGSFDNLNMPMSVIGLSWSYGSGQSGLVGEVLGNSTNLRVRNARYDGHGYIVTANNMTNASRIWFSGSYRTS